MDVLVQPAMKAGDVLFFMDGAQTHAPCPGKQNTSADPSSTNTPAERWQKKCRALLSITDMTPEQLAVMWGPYANYHEEHPGH